MLTDQLIERFWEYVPRPFAERTLRCLFDAYRVSADYCSDFDGPERLTLRPFYRRSVFERDWRAVASQFLGQGVTAQAVKFEGKGFWWHTRVVCGNSVALTQSPVAHPDEMVRASRFRAKYAGNKNQLWLIPDAAPPDLENAIPDLAAPLLYGVLIYARSRETPSIPGFAQVRFPNEQLTTYYAPTVDLFAEFPEVVTEKTAEIAAVRPNEDADEIVPELLEDDNVGG